MIVAILLLQGFTLAAHCLSVSPQSSSELEGESVQFICREDNNVYATEIVWQDPFGNTYTPGSQYVGRILAEESWLSITNIVRNDSGLYRCERTSDATDFAEGRLYVHAPPAILNGVPIQEILYGATSLLKCEVDRGFPLASILWLHVHIETGEQSQITNTLYPRFKIVEDGLEISNVQLSDEGLYRCYVYNLYDTVQLDIQTAFRAPAHFLDSNVSLEFILAIGQRAKLDCTAGGAPFPTYMWSVWPESQPEKELSWNTSVAIIRGSDISNREHYICTATNEEGSVSRVFTLNAATPAHFLDSNVSLEFILAIGQRAKLDCTAGGAPFPTYMWSVWPESQPEKELSWNTSVAIIQGSDISNREHYICTATNEEGSVSRVFTLNAASPPQPTYQQYYHTFQLNQTVELHCNVSALPKPEFRWIPTNPTVFDDFSWVSSFANQTATSMFSYKFQESHLDRNCSIHIVCIATNLHGRSEQFFTLYLNKKDSTCFTLSPSVSISDLSDDTQQNEFPVVIVISVCASFVVSLATISTVLAVFKSMKVLQLKKHHNRIPEDVSVSSGRCLVSGKQKHTTSAICDTTNSSGEQNKRFEIIETSPNAAYGNIKPVIMSDNKPHVYEFVN